jgi:hypothetical protein
MRIPTPADSNGQRGGAVKLRGFGEWNKATVYRILRNETYIGIWHYGKRNGRARKNNGPEHYIRLDVPAIVEYPVWAATRERLDLNRRNYARKISLDYLLRARVTCGECMSSMKC